MAATTKYSIIRFSPDPTRGEVINIGLAIFLRDRIDVRVVPSAHRLRTLNPNTTADVISTLEVGIPELFKGNFSDEDRWDLLSNFPMIQLSEMGEFADWGSTYEGRVQALMDRLVKVPAAKRQKERLTKLDKELRTAFSASNILGHDSDDINSHRVIQKFPIAPSEQLYADFALKNGRMHVTAVVDFRVDERSIKSTKRGQAAIKAITLDAAHRRFGDSSCVTYAVFAASDEYRDLVQPQVQMLGDYADRVFDFTSRDDQAAYMSLMVEAAHAS